MDMEERLITDCVMVLMEETSSSKNVFLNLQSYTGSSLNEEEIVVGLPVRPRSSFLWLERSFYGGTMLFGSFMSPSNKLPEF